MKENLLFKKWYNSLPKDKYIEARNKVIENCGISYAVFYNWYGGISPIPILAQKEIERIAGEKIF
jgi:hypothetical protein